MDNADPAIKQLHRIADALEGMLEIKRLEWGETLKRMAAQDEITRLTMPALRSMHEAVEKHHNAEPCASCAKDHGDHESWCPTQTAKEIGG